MSNAFVAPGTSQRNQEVNQQSGYSGSVYNSLWPGLSSYLKNAQSFQNSQQGNLQQGVENSYTQTTQGGRDAMVNSMGGELQSQARSQSGQAGGQFAGNPSLARAAGLAAMNNVNTGTANYASQVNSQPAQAQAWGNYASLLGQASPNYSSLGAMNSAIYGQPQVPVGQGLGGVLGSLIGPAAAGFNPGLLLSALGSVGGGAPSSTNPVATPNQFSGQTMGPVYNEQTSNYTDPFGPNFLG